MARKDYKAIADLLNSILMHGAEIDLCRAQYDFIVDQFVLGLRARYPNFNVEAFRKACD